MPVSADMPFHFSMAKATQDDPSRSIFFWPLFNPMDGPMLENKCKPDRFLNHHIGSSSLILYIIKIMNHEEY